MAVAATIMDTLFQRTLDDVVKGLRVQVIGESRYLMKALDEVRKEIKSTDAHIKVVALQKLTYLNMLQGTEMGWASFYIIEVMSMPKFAHKKIGYLAASQAFHDGTDVLVLITNLLRKDLCSKNEYEAGLALDCLSRIATPDLARDLTPEVFSLLASSRAYIRKKVTLALLRTFSKYPEAIRVAFRRLVEKMEDPDTQVVNAAVSVFCELAVKDSKAYLLLAQDFHRVLVASSNNWMCIKLVKIFGALAPIEPRLGRKIAGPICDHMQKTSAKSLALECIRTVMAGLADHEDAVKLSVKKLQELLAEDDPNLKYVGLHTLASVLSIHPWAVTENKEVIVRCLDDEDISIRMASLCLIVRMTNETNLVETVQVLLQYLHCSEPEFGNQIISSILSTCSRALYELVSDFSWYVNVLGEIAKVPHNKHGEEVARQLIDIGLRVADVREDLVREARYLLLDPTLLGVPSFHPALSAAAWVSGEYVGFSLNAYELIESLLQPRTLLLPPAVHAIYLQALLKMVIHVMITCLQGQAEERHLKLTGTGLESNSGEESYPGRYELPTTDGHLDPDMPERKVVSQGCSLGCSLSTLETLLVDNVSALANNVHMEVQERACNILGLLPVLRETHEFLSQEADDTCADEQCSLQAADILRTMKSVFSVLLGPVSLSAQDRVVVPEALILETSLDAIGLVPCGDGGVERDAEQGGPSGQQMRREWDGRPSFAPQQTQEASSANSSAALLAQHRQRNEAYYLADDPKPSDEVHHPPQGISSLDSFTPGARLAQGLLVGTNSCKPKRSKVRPVVVKLEDESVISESKSKKVLKDDFMVNAIRDVFYENRSKTGTTSEGAAGAELRRHSSSTKHRLQSHSSAKVPDKVGVAVPHGFCDALVEPDGDEVQVESHALQESAAHHKNATGSKQRKKKDDVGRSKDREDGHRVADNISGKQRRQRHDPKQHRQRARSTIALIPETLVSPDLLL